MNTLNEQQEQTLAGFLTEENSVGNDVTFAKDDGSYIISEGLADADDLDFLSFLNEGA